MSDRFIQPICLLCGAMLEPCECGPCHGTGEDVDMNNGAGGTCECCDGSGQVYNCPNIADAEHLAAMVNG